MRPELAKQGDARTSDRTSASDLALLGVAGLLASKREEGAHGQTKPEIWADRQVEASRIFSHSVSRVPGSIAGHDHGAL